MLRKAHSKCRVIDVSSGRNSALSNIGKKTYIQCGRIKNSILASEDDNYRRSIIAIIGAGGTAGSKVTEKLLQAGNYVLRLCEKGEGISKLQKMGLTPYEIEKALPESDVVIMTVPDSKIEAVTKNVVPMMKKGATMILLDPAAAYLREVTLRDDCTFVVAHPCHPPLFGKQETAEAYNDFFGGIAKQDIVIALLRGDEGNFKMVEKICMDSFAPVKRCHRLTVEQMAVLEPMAAEIVAGSAADLMKEALEEAVRHGVPEEAARAFMLGHISIILAIFFGKTEHRISEAAIEAIKYGRGRIFKGDWKEIFRDEEMRKIIHDILH